MPAERALVTIRTFIQWLPLNSLRCEAARGIGFDRAIAPSFLYRWVDIGRKRNGIDSTPQLASNRRPQDPFRFGSYADENLYRSSRNQRWTLCYRRSYEKKAD